MPFGLDENQCRGYMESSKNQIKTMKHLLPIFFITMLLGACGMSNPKPTPMPGDLYPAEYVTAFDELPYNIQFNKRAEYHYIDSQKEYRTINLAYPDYEAEGSIALVMVDSARLLPTIERRLRLLEMRSDTSCVIETSRNASGIRYWVFIHPKGKEQIQWMATDSLSMSFSGGIHFVAATDSTVDITPALENIKTDLRYLLDNLKVSQPE